MDAASLRSAPTSLPEYLPASQYLQNRLQERRARNIRPKHARRSDFGPSTRGRDDDIFFDEAEAARINARRFDSSPLTASGRAGSDAGVVGSSKRRAPGMRDVDEQLDRLNKENFALKLELDHRRDHTVKLQQQMTEMQAQVDRAETLEAEHAELLRINSQLVEELEKRDKAVEEAMDIICDLEDKVAEMDERSSQTRPSTAQADSGYAGTETHETVPRSSPPQLKTPRKDRAPPTTASTMANRLFQAVNVETPAKIRREPSVLSQQKPSTHALRSVYLEAAGNLHPVKSFNSLLSRRENAHDESAPELESPRLSVLSESSFPSLYSPNQEKSSPEKHAWEEEDAQEDSIKRINRWIDEGNAIDDTPSRSRRLSLQVSESTVRPTPPPPNDLEQQTRDPAALPRIPLDQHQEQVLHTRESSYGRRPYPSRTGLLRTNNFRPNSIAGPIFGESSLPPTPQSASTRLLRTSRSSMGEERSILDFTPAPIKGYAALEAGVRTAPRQMRSSVELKTAHHSNQSFRESAVDDENESRSDTIKDLAGEYAGYPDGKSILMGTPSRFIKHGAPPASNLMFDGSDASPTRGAESSPRRRKSSSEAALSPWRPSLGRAGTSPPLPSKAPTNFSRLTIDSTIASPKSCHSNSSGNRTVIQPKPDDSFELVSSRTSISAVAPSRSLGQKTQRLFRRFSGGPQDQPLPTLDARSYREKPPLPKLTSTPSSAYTTMIPREIRRPSTAGPEKQSQFSPVARPASSARDRHASRSRSRTGEPRSSSVAAVERLPDDRDKKSPSRRSQSVKQPTAVMDAPPPMPVASLATTASGEEPKGLFTRRRHSIKDAVIGLPRRTWRTSGNINANNL